MDDAVPKSSPNGLINLPLGSVVVEDAGEEIMELYMNLATITTDSSGLGFLDSSASLLELDLIIEPGPSNNQKTEQKLKGKMDKQSVKVTGRTKDVVVPVKVQQDLNLLKGSKGDTGSVLWRSSLHLARHLLSQHYFPPTDPFFSPTRLASARVLELGSGTGLLASLFSPLCPQGTWVASDRQENLRLLYRNLELNGRVAPSSPLSAHKTLPPGPHSRHHTTTVSVHGKTKKQSTTGKSADPAMNVKVEEVDWADIANFRHLTRLKEDQVFDLVLAVDCIFNESLCGPLVATLSRYCPVGGKACCLVVVELRSADVLELFLETWLNDPSGPWRIVRLAEDAMGSWNGNRPRWVGWVGWRDA